MVTVWNDEQLIAVLRNTAGLMKYPGGLPVAANVRAIRSGDVLAKNTNNDHVQVCKFTELSATSAQTDTTLDVDDAHPFEVGDVITLDDGTNTETLTIASINYDTNVITTTAGVAQAAGYAADTDVFVATNNQDNPIGIALVPHWDRDANRTGNNVDLVTPKMSPTQYGDIAIMGVFKLTAIKNFRVGTRMDTELGGADLADNDTYVISSIPATNYSLT